MTSTYRRLEIQLPQFWHVEQAAADEKAEELAEKEAEADEAGNESSRTQDEWEELLGGMCPVGDPVAVDGIERTLRGSWQGGVTHGGECGLNQTEVAACAAATLVEQQPRQRPKQQNAAEKPASKGDRAAGDAEEVARAKAASEAREAEQLELARSNLWQTVVFRAKYRRVLRDFAEGSPVLECQARLQQEMVGTQALAMVAPEDVLSCDENVLQVEINHATDTIAKSLFQDSRFERRIVVEEAEKLGLEHDFGPAADAQAGREGVGAGLQPEIESSTKAVAVAMRGVAVQGSNRYVRVWRRFGDSGEGKHTRLLVLKSGLRYFDSVDCADGDGIEEEKTTEKKTYEEKSCFRVLDGPFEAAELVNSWPDIAHPECGRVRTRLGWSHYKDEQGRVLFREQEAKHTVLTAAGPRQSRKLGDKDTRRFARVNPDDGDRVPYSTSNNKLITEALARGFEQVTLANEPSVHPSGVGGKDDEKPPPLRIVKFGQKVSNWGFSESDGQGAMLQHSNYGSEDQPDERVRRVVELANLDPNSMAAGVAVRGASSAVNRLWLSDVVAQEAEEEDKALRLTYEHFRGWIIPETGVTGSRPTAVGGSGQLVVSSGRQNTRLLTAFRARICDLILDQAVTKVQARVVAEKGRDAEPKEPLESTVAGSSFEQGPAAEVDDVPSLLPASAGGVGETADDAAWARVEASKTAAEKLVAEKRQRAERFDFPLRIVFHTATKRTDVEVLTKEAMRKQLRETVMGCEELWQDSLEDIEPYPLFTLHSLGDAQAKARLEDAEETKQSSAKNLEKARRAVKILRREQKHHAKEARRSMADSEQKLAQVLAVLNNTKKPDDDEDMGKGMSNRDEVQQGLQRAPWRKDTREVRDREQVVHMNASGVTVLWLNCTIGRLDELLRDLERECVEGKDGRGWLGTRHGTVTVLDVTVANPKPLDRPAWEFAQQHCLAGWIYPTGRLPVEEMYANIMDGSEFTGGFAWSLICAAAIAALGLFTNSSVMLVASMLISPMMGPILAITFGMAIQTTTTQAVYRKHIKSPTKIQGGAAGLDEDLRTPFGGRRHQRKIQNEDLVLLHPHEFEFNDVNGKRHHGKRHQLAKIKKIVEAKVGTAATSTNTASSVATGVKIVSEQGHRGDQEFREVEHYVIETMAADDDSDARTRTNNDARTRTSEPKFAADWDDSKPKNEKMIDRQACELKLEQLRIGDQVPFLNHCATVEEVLSVPKTDDKNQFEDKELRACYPSHRNPSNIQELETVYKLRWDPAECLDSETYDKTGVAKSDATKRLSDKDFSTARNKLISRGVKTEAKAAVVAIISGFLAGPLFLWLTEGSYISAAKYGQFYGWPPLTSEMKGRGDPYNFFTGIVFAIASGVVVGNGASSGGTNALVGVAISASLLPPLVNSGICIAYALLGPIWHPVSEWENTWDTAPEALEWAAEEPAWSTQPYHHPEMDGIDSFSLQGKLLMVALISTCLYLMNITVILVVCWGVFKVKGVEFRDPDLLRSKPDTGCSDKEIADSGGKRTSTHSDGRDTQYRPLPDVTLKSLRRIQSHSSHLEGAEKSPARRMRRRDTIGIATMY